MKNLSWGIIENLSENILHSRPTFGNQTDEALT